MPVATNRDAAHPHGLEKDSKSAAWQRLLGFTDGEILVALDRAVDRADEARDVTEWPEGMASARLVTRLLDPGLLAITWGSEAVARRLTQMERRGLVGVEPGFPALWTVTPEGDELLARLEVLDGD